MTLVEVVVVIAVVGILAAVLAPSVGGALKRERQRQVASDVANVFREARNQAMSRGEALTVLAEQATNSVRIVQSSTRPRSCREENLVTSFDDDDERKVYSVASRASADMVLLNDVHVCFDASGGLHVRPGMGAATGVCADERIVVQLADADADAPSSSLTCGSVAADYEMVGGYVIRLMDSGEISLRTPPNE